MKLPGAGGAADIAAMSERLIAIMNHEKHRLVDQVQYITSPGFLDGGDARQRAGLPGAGPAAVITDRAIMRPHGASNELHLYNVHPGHTQAEIIENTGWDLKIAPGLSETPKPTSAEMDALHQIDKDGYWR